MLSNLSQKLSQTFAKLRGKGRVSEADVDAAMREVRLALLEADVNFKIVKEFVAKVRERAVGVEVLESLSPDQQVIAIVRDELQQLLGGSRHRLNWSSQPPTVILLAGLQGTGKTTTCAKLAGLLKREGKKPLLVACDIYRPGAILQLQTVGEQIGAPVFEMGTAPPPQIAREALKYAREHAHDVVILDTAGRLHVDEAMMAEVRQVHDVAKPDEVLLALDAMTGQDAVNAAQAFHDTIPLTGVILTKLDGDARGGAILSVRAVTGVPVKFVGLGEKLDAIEPFFPDRMAGRILGMGDVLSLIEKAEHAFTEKQAVHMEAKLREGNFDLEDFLSQLQEVRKMGPLENILGMIPGMNKMVPQGGAGLSVDEKHLGRVEAIIRSMTPKERRDPELINGSRKRRIAAGSGTSVQDVNRLLGQFRDMRKMLRQMSAMASGKVRMPRGFNPMARMR
ncbi:MAG: signal recognition particle subunit [Abditibacteriota bacterium]|nr:signal recognition particle subunit [Abditibacteriota bacterium]